MSTRKLDKAIAAAAAAQEVSMQALTDARHLHVHSLEWEDLLMAHAQNLGAWKALLKFAGRG